MHGRKALSSKGFAGCETSIVKIVTKTLRYPCCIMKKLCLDAAHPFPTGSAAFTEVVGLTRSTLTISSATRHALSAGSAAASRRLIPITLHANTGGSVGGNMFQVCNNDAVYTAVTPLLLLLADAVCERWMLLTWTLLRETCPTTPSRA